MGKYTYFSRIQIKRQIRSVLPLVKMTFLQNVGKNVSMLSNLLIPFYVTLVRFFIIGINNL